jgi:hypothetical protein
MTGTMKAMCQAAALALLLAVATAAPAKAQFGGGSGGEDMMTQFAPMLEMMKAKKRFAALMQTMGPMMSNMMEGGGGGLGGMLGGGGGFGFSNNMSMGGDLGQFTGGGGDFMGMMGSSGMTAMLPQMMSMINTGTRSGRRSKKKRG